MNTDKLIVKAKALFELPHGRCKHFTFIMKRNKIISLGWNNTIKTHPWAAKYGHKFYAIHSELQAIKNFPYPVAEICNYDFVNIRIRKDGKLGIARPCEACERLLIAFRPQSVIYTTNEGTFRRFI